MSKDFRVKTPKGLGGTRPNPDWRRRWQGHLMMRRKSGLLSRGMARGVDRTLSQIVGAGRTLEISPDPSI
jgi:Na+-transporting NADH:ubiquinone oxidoreductase subunit NqrC